MNHETFVNALRQQVRDSAVEEVVGLLDRPPGRRPSQELLELGAWYAQLSVADREGMRRSMALVAKHVTFGFCNILDGNRAVENGPAKGRFELVHVSAAGARTVLVGHEVAPLHEIL